MHLYLQCLLEGLYKNVPGMVGFVGDEADEGAGVQAQGPRGRQQDLGKKGIGHITGGLLAKTMLTRLSIVISFNKLKR